MSSNIKVAVRCRPLFENERPAVGLDFQHGRRIILDNKTYDPDYIFNSTATQDDIFAVCQPILQSVKNGLHGTVMVYGQTGTGKTHTMLGSAENTSGIAHRMIAAMLEHVQTKTLEGSKCALTLSMIEIYNEKLTDMLSDNGNAEVALVAGFPKSMVKLTLSRLNDALDAIQRGISWRHCAVTSMNERSSRSHVVIILDFEEYNAYTETVDVAHLFLVDLAGSESLKKSQVSGTTAAEAGKINKSLLALKSVFLALANTSEATRPNHVPYRDSKLTELLRDSIGGSARTLMVACISPVGRDIEETKSTLMYAVKARSIRNAANTEREKLLVRLRSFELENQRLRNRLQEKVIERGGYYVNREEHERLQQLEEEHQALKGDVDDLMRGRQQNEAQQHISVSQINILQGIVEEKEEELLRFKQTYHEALMHFDSQVGLLQRVVQEAVRGAHEAAQRGAEAVVGKLEQWRANILRETAASGNAAKKKKEEKNNEQFVEVEAENNCEQEEREEDGLAFCSVYNKEAARVVANINARFSALAQDVLVMTRRHCSSAEALRERRRVSLESLQRTVEERVREALAAHAREQMIIDREHEAEHRLFESGVSAAVERLPPPADVLPFRHLLENVCRDVVGSSRDYFPPAEVGEEVVVSLQQINDSLRLKGAAASLTALVNIGNAPLQRNSNSSLSTNGTTNSTAATLSAANVVLADSEPLHPRNTNCVAGNGSGKMKRFRSSSSTSDSRHVFLRHDKQV